MAAQPRCEQLEQQALHLLQAGSGQLHRGAGAGWLLQGACGAEEAGRVAELGQFEAGPEGAQVPEPACIGARV